MFGQHKAPSSGKHGGNARIILKALAALAVAASGCGGGVEGSDGATKAAEKPRSAVEVATSAGAKTLLSALRLRYFTPADEPGSKHETILAPGTVERFERTAGGISPRFAARAAGQRTRVRLPERADQPFRLEDAASGVSVEVSLEGAHSAAAEVADGYLVFSKAHASGATLLHRASLDGLEDYLSFDERPRTPSVSYKLALQQGIAGLRLVSGTLEMLDKGGAPRLRVAPPYIVGADGVRTDAALSVEGCAVDTNPAPPWGRGVTPPGAAACTVRVSWADHAVAYPALLDPHWSTTQSMSTLRCEHTATILSDGRVLVVGGRSDLMSTTALSTSEVFDPGTNSWGTVRTLNAARRLHAAVLLNTSGNTMTSGKVLVTGGTSQSSARSSAELYDPVAGTWSSTPLMQPPGNAAIPRYQHTATVLKDGRVLLVGGVTSTGTTNSAITYDPTTGSGTWLLTSSPPGGPRRSHIATRLSGTNDKWVIVAGGNSGGTSSITSVQAFNSETATWAQRAALPEARDGHTASLLPDGKILVAGGRTGSSTLDTSRIYDPAGSGSWGLPVTMRSLRQGHSATLLPPGAPGVVLLAGGSDGSDFLQSAEVWNGSSWQTTSTLGFRVRDHAAAALGDGRVLLAGGIDSTGPIRTAQVYDPLSCTSASDCASGHCVDGVCCNEPCNGTCMACNLGSSRGVCAAEPTTASCNDNNACTTGDRCNGAGACSLSTPVAVDDGNLCTTDSCNPATGSVSHVAVTNVCPDNGCYVAGSCNPSTGRCTTAEDGTLCNTEHPCTPDGDRCVAGTCLPQADVCTLASDGSQYLPIIEINKPGKEYSYAYDINDNGVVVGGSADYYAWGDWGTDGFIWSEPGLDPIVPDPSTPFPAGFNPRGINNEGVISGTAFHYQNSSGLFRSFRFDPRTQPYPEIFGNSAGRGINSYGIMTGCVVDAAGLVAFTKDDGPMQVIPEVPGPDFDPIVAVQGIDDDGDLVGYAVRKTTDPNPPWGSTAAAFRYSKAREVIEILDDLIPGSDTSWQLRWAYASNGHQIVGGGVRNDRKRAFRMDFDGNDIAQVPVELPLPGDWEEMPASSVSGIAHDINSNGDIAGAVYDNLPTWPLAAVVWLDGVPYDLNDYINDPHWVLRVAQAINNRRPDGSFDVVGYGDVNGKSRAFKMRVPNLRPCPAPDGECLISKRDLSTGLCRDVPTDDGATCDDGDVCTSGDSCRAGQCSGAEDLSCAAAIELAFEGMAHLSPSQSFAIFSYTNHSSENQNVPYGSENHVSMNGVNGADLPNPDRRIPEWFKVRTHGVVVPWHSTTTSMSWTVGDETVSADNSQIEVIETSEGRGVTVGGEFIVLDPVDSSILAASVVATDFITAPDGTKTAGGTLSGALSVSADGAAEYVIPFQLPPGRAGLQPRLALQYNSRKGNGSFGVGWSLTGLSAITRCNKKVTYGEVADAIRFDGTDPFCWNGVRLRGIRPGNNAAMEFRTEEESYARIMVPLGATDAAGPVRFQVETVDGLIHHFHAVHSTARVTPVDEGGEDSPDYSQITSHFDTAAPVRLSWLLTETRDRNGNSISYDYTTPANVADPPPTPATPEAAHAEEALLSRVRYNDDQVEIRFDYEARPDPSYSYVSGVRLSDTVRCTSITVNVPITGEVVRRYRLAYSNTKSISKRSLLTSVRECDRSDVCKRPTEFEWTGGAQQFADHIIENVPVETTWGVLNNPPVYSLSAGDFNGDGLDDIVFRTALTDLERNEIAWVVRLGTGSGFGPAQVIDINEDNSAFIQHREASEIRVSDLNMDGRADIVVRTIRPVNQGNVTHYMYFWQMFLSRGDGTFDGPAGMVSGINDWSLGTAHIGDFNGDGVPDFVSETSPPEGDVIEGSWWDVDYGDGTGKTVRFSGFGVKLSTPELPTSLLPVPVSIIDTTGSGAASLLTPVWYENPSPSTVKPRLRDGTQSWSNLRMRITGEFDTFLPGDETRDVYNYFGDINGDGLLDALTWVPPHIWLGGWGLQPRALVNAGTGFLAPQVPNLVAIPPTETEAALGASKRYKILTLDWDQDARDDFLIVDTSPHNSPQRPFPTILVSRPDGFEVVSPPGMPETLVHSSSHNLSLDANGDGLTDLLLDHFPAVPGELLRLWVRVGGRADLLSSVTNGLGATETVEYSPMTRASGIYTPGDCSAPTYCVTRGPLAVSTVRHDPGRVGARTDRYQYADARIGLKGRGWLGVGRRFFHQVENNVQTTSTFGISDFDGTRYPKAGKLLEEHTQAGTLSFLTTNTYETSPRGDGVFAVRLMGRTQRKWQGGGQTTILSQIDETFEYDFAGALERRESVTSDGYSSVEVYRDTVNDFANWIIHRPTRIETTETDPQGRTETRVRETRYDDRGSVTDTLVEPDEATDPESEVYSRTHFDYSSLGVVRQITTSDAADAERVTTFRLSPGELYPREIVDPEGHVSRQILHPAYGSAVWESDRNGVTTTRTVDAFGRQKFERRAGTAFRSWKYLPGRVGSAEGVTLEQRELLGPTRLTSVDHRGRPIIEAHVDDTGNWSIVDTEYEGAGLNVVTQSRPHAENQSALRSRYEYDNLGRLVRFVPAGDNGYFTRDFFGRTIALRDAKGGFSVTRLDDLGRTIENTAYRDLAPLATPITTTYQYSVFGTLRRIALPGEANVSIGYDKLGRRTSLVDPDAGESIFHYNGFGDLVSRTDGNENVETMQPDRLGRTVLRTSDDGEQRFDWDHAENGFGKLAGTSTQPAGSSQEAVSQTFGYDAFGRPERASFRIGADSYSIRSEFDGQGRLSVVHYPSRGSTALAVRYAYNPHTGLLGLVSDADVPETEFWRALERDGEGRVTRWRLGNGVVETASYDVLGRLEAIGATNDTAHGITALRYDYDLVGNVESRTDDILETTETFGYDGLQRLTHWNYSAGVGEWGIRYPYENNGNLKGRIVEMGNGDSLDFVYGQNGAGPHAITTSHLGGYSYDGAGRQTSAPGRPLVTYDMRGLPRSVQRSNGGEVIFSYGAGGERARKRAGDTTTTYVGALYEHRESGSSSHEVLSVLAGGRKIAEIRRSSGAIEQVVSYFHRDRLGSTIAVTDESGGMVERTAYDPFGRRFDHNVSPLVDAAPLSSTTVGFAELEEDPEVDLINMNARLYDPNTGRFISPDPLVGELLDAQTFNRYSYARNNPVTLADPTGLDPYIQISSGSASEPSFNPFGSLLSAALGILTSWTGGGGEAAAPISAPALSGTTTSMGAVTRQAVLTPVADSQDNRAAAVLEWNQINEHAYLLDKAPFDMSETVKMLRDDLIQRVLKLYSIDPSGFEVVYTPNVKAHDLKGKDEVTVAITNSILRTIGIGPREFDSISKLAGSVFHETRHARQAADFNVGASGEVGGALNELEAYLLTLKNADTLGLDIGEIWQARAQAEEYYWILTFDPGYMRQLDGYPPSFDVRTLERMELDMWREIHLLVEAVDRRLSR